MSTFFNKKRNDLIDQFYEAPMSALFNQEVIAAVLACSTALMERNRWAGKGVPFIKINHSVRYRKSDVLEWLENFLPQSKNSANKTGEV